MTPERLTEIGDLLGDKVAKWSLATGDWINIAEELHDALVETKKDRDRYQRDAAELRAIMFRGTS